MTRAGTSGAAHQSQHRVRDDRVAQLFERRRAPKIAPCRFTAASVDVVGPAGAIAARALLREGRLRAAVSGGQPRRPPRLMIVSNKGVCDTAARELIDNVCGGTTCRCSACTTSTTPDS